MAKLIIEAKGEKPRAVALEADTVRIGSADGNEIRIRSPEVSREHCEIRRSGMIYRLVDLESKGGTRVNGAFVNQHPLEDGDRIELGPLSLRFVREGPQNGVTVAPRTAPGRAARPARPRPRRPAGPRRPSAAPVAVLCVAVGLALAVVAVLALRGGSEETPNETILRTMRDLADGPEDPVALRKALGEAARADRSGDRETLAAIDQLAESIRYRLEGPPPPPGEAILRQRMRQLLQRVERGLDEHSEEPEVLLAALDEMLDAEGHRVLPEVPRLRSARQDVIDAIELAKGDIPNRYRTASARVEELVSSDRYGEAIDTYRAFLNENYEKMTDAERQEYKQRVETRRIELEKQASGAYHDAVDLAGNYLARGMPARAVRVYEKVIDRYGLSVFEEKARAAIERIKKP